MGMVDQRDHQWLAWNERVMRNQQTYPSKKNMILMMFNFGYHLFPTLNDIMAGLIKAQIEHLKH